MAELEAIAEYIALDKPAAARRLMQRVFSSVARLARFPASGSRIPEIPRSVHRQIAVWPCRIFYRYDGRDVFIVYVMRGERQFKEEFLEERET